jgi:hypothetical protein
MYVPYSNKSEDANGNKARLANSLANALWTVNAKEKAKPIIRPLFAE